MNLKIPDLHKLFDHLPEAVFLYRGHNLQYCNPVGQALLPQDGSHPPFLLDLLTEGSECKVLCSQDGLYHITISYLSLHRLIIMRTLQDPKSPQLTNAVPAQLRAHLSNLALTTEQLALQLSREDGAHDYRDLLSIQTQATCRILRLTRQMELSYDNWASDFPLGAVDLASICRAISSELNTRRGETGPRFFYRSDLPSLLMRGNRSLLQQLIFALLSNAIKSAGPEGAVELSLIQKRGRAVLSVWDSGQSIPEDRLAHLFSPHSAAGLPRPNEGAGLDLWICHRIAFFHSGVIMAGNRPQGGTEFTVSLPTTPPDRLQFQSQDSVPAREGYSPLLIGLADALPSQAFDPLES